jgi:hypothetical protein
MSMGANEVDDEGVAAGGAGVGLGARATVLGFSIGVRGFLDA